jgi:hypothetical protein
MTDAEFRDLFTHLEQPVEPRPEFVERLLAEVNAVASPSGAAADHAEREVPESTNADGPMPEQAYVAERKDHRLLARAGRRGRRWRAIGVVAAAAAVIAATAAVVLTPSGKDQSSVVARPHIPQPKPVATLPASPTTAPPVTPPGSQLYWRDWMGVYHSNLDGTAMVRVVRFPNAQINGAAPCMAADRNYVYWTNGIVETVVRADRDGTGLDTTFITAGLPAGALDRSGGFSCIAVDGSHIYWVNLARATIGHANLDGTGVNQDFITGFGNPDAAPCGLAVDGANIYWGNTSRGTVGRANLDGTGVNQDFITGIAHGPCVGVAEGAHIYWGNSDGTIGRANVDGTGVNNGFISDTGANVVPILCADSTYLYWADDRGSPQSSTSTIGRARLDGTDVEPDFMTGAHQPSGCAVAPGQ